jgi:hypothetical protein
MRFPIDDDIQLAAEKAVETDTSAASWMSSSMGNRMSHGKVSELTLWMVASKF